MIQHTHISLSTNSNTMFDYSGWGGNLEGAGFRTTQQAGITPRNVNTLQLKWSFAFPDESDVRSKPAIVGDWIIVVVHYCAGINSEYAKLLWL